MELYIKQKLFSWGDKFSVYDRDGNERYYVEGEVFTWGKKLHLYDLTGRELAFIQEKFSFLRPTFHILRNGQTVAEIVKEFTFFRQRYSVHGPDWSVEGAFWTHDYQVSADGRSIVSVSKEWFTLGDAYQLQIAPDVDEVLALAVVLVIDACIDQAESNA